eukprot:TRINITY_DN30065_c0_g1_i2.p1 TRINITY_DN30065_c0_g1~~TRINITY_DN30065_c0_g1_i2.p1  ORF type:complete len:404 (+),score=80.04 TRINITY_DN30065_c0_g1_i2:139-1212(+)
MVVKMIATSVNVSFRCRMHSGKMDNSVQDTFGWWKPGETFPATILGEVTETKSASWKVGDRLQGTYPLQRYFVAKGDGSDQPFGMKPQRVDKSTPVEKNFSIMSPGGGLTAFIALESAYTPAAELYSKFNASGCLLSALSSILPCGGLCAPSPKYDFRGKVAVVTAASSNVGVTAGQLLKMRGCKKVIAVTSTKEKGQQLVEHAGFDSAVAYQEEDVVARLKELAPEGIDFDLEMAGGKILDAVLLCLNKFGKVVVVGNMDGSNKHASEQTGNKQMDALVAKSVELSGFFIADYPPLFPKAFLTMSQYAKSGKVKSIETVVKGFEKWGQALEMVLSSKKIGQVVLYASDDDCTVAGA